MHPGVRDERRDIAIAVTGLRQQHEVRVAGAVRFEFIGNAHREFGAQNAANADGLTRGAEADDAPHFVVVRNGQGRVAEFGGALGERLGERRPIKEREGGMAVQFRVDSWGRTGHDADREWPRI